MPSLTLAATFIHAIFNFGSHFQPVRHYATFSFGNQLEGGGWWGGLEEEEVILKQEGVDLDVGFSNITGEERFQEKSGLPGGVVFC